MKNVATGNLTLNVSAASINPSKQPSDSETIDGSGVYTSPLPIIISGYTDTSISGGSGTGVINSSAQFNTIDGDLVMLEGDNVDILVTGVKPGTDTPTTKTINVKIQSAGQDKVKAE